VLQLATSYFGFKPVHNIIDEKLRMQLDVIRDAAAVVIQKYARRYVVQQRMKRDRWWAAACIPFLSLEDACPHTALAGKSCAITPRWLFSAQCVSTTVAGCLSLHKPQTSLRSGTYDCKRSQGAGSADDDYNVSANSTNESKKLSRTSRLSRPFGGQGTGAG
jgi:hypothetical protein